MYFVGASTYSVTTELFGDGLRATAQGDTVTCARELAALSEGLHTSAGKTISAPEGASSVVWLRTWDRRLAELQQRCGVVRDRHRQLATLRSSIGVMLRQHQRESAPNRKSLERALEALIPSS